MYYIRGPNVSLLLSYAPIFFRLGQTGSEPLGSQKALFWQTKKVDGKKLRKYIEEFPNQGSFSTTMNYSLVNHSWSYTYLLQSNAENFLAERMDCVINSINHHFICIYTTCTSVWHVETSDLINIVFNRNHFSSYHV